MDIRYAVVLNAALTVVLFLLSQGLQARKSIKDQAAKDFDDEVTTPLREGHDELRKLGQRVMTAADINDPERRNTEIDKILEEQARSALDSFFLKLKEFDTRNPGTSIWMPLGIKLEEVIFPALSNMKSASGTSQLRSGAHSVTEVVATVICATNQRARADRKVYVSKAPWFSFKQT